MMRLFLINWLLIFHFQNNPCKDFNQMILGLTAKEVIENYPKLYDICPKEASYIPSFLPLKNYENVYLSSAYGNRIHPIKGILKHHNGIDIACNIQEVIATASGTISETGYNNGLGNYIRINHLNGFETTYAHLSKIVTNLGASIIIGQTIGITGNTGMATGTHIHYEVRKNGQKQNPLDFLLLFYRTYESIYAQNIKK